METCMLSLQYRSSFQSSTSCKFLTCKHKNMRVSRYFLYLVLTFTPHYIITDKGLLKKASLRPCVSELAITDRYICLWHSLYTIEGGKS